MPDTPNFAITYPCMGPTVDPAAFSEFAADVEAAIASVDAQAAGVVGLPYAFASLTTATAFGVEAIMTMSNTSGSGITIGASTYTIVTPGLYVAGATASNANQSTLTYTSQRVAVYVNGVFFAACKWRGVNPADVFVMGGSYSVNVPLLAGDVVTYRYLWTGTGAISGSAGGLGSLMLLATP